MSTEAQISSLSNMHYTRIEELAEMNYAPSDIALELRIPKKAFLQAWRDYDNPIRQAYDRGRLQSAITKDTALMKSIEGGNITAIQIHDKKADERAFEDIKSQIFSNE